MVYFGTKLSDNISKREPEGYLICLNVPVARTGIQEYLPSELGLPGPDDRLIPVRRPPEEVFSPACIASFEGMPVTDGHPREPEGVTAENIARLQKGHAHNVRRGAGDSRDLLLADLIITDPGLIRRVMDGRREISCGYTYTLCPEEAGYVQRDIRGNHVAVVDAGRAGPRVSIRDERKPMNPTKPTQERSIPMKKTAKQNRLQARMMIRLAKDGDAEGLEELLGELLEEPAEAAEAAEAAPESLPAEAPVVVETPVEQPVIIDCGAEILSALKEIIGLLAGRAGDCGPDRQTDDAPEEAAEAAAEIVEAAEEAVAEIAETAEEAGDPVDALVAEILTEAPDAPEAAGETEAEAAAEIISQVLEPETESDPEKEAEAEAADNRRTADALRAALAAFRPQMRKMDPRERRAFVTDVSRQMKRLSGSRPGAYAALARPAASRDASGRDLGNRIMKSRNINYGK